jgi:CHAD domain-containing protein
MAKPFKVKKLSPTRPAQKAALRILLTRLEEFYAHWPDPDEWPTPEELHNLRISGKRLRYSAETLRDFYPDRLALLVELLKKGQDVLGEYQDCVTHRAALAADLARQRRLHPRSRRLNTLKNLLASLDERQALLFAQFAELWRGITMPEFRDCLEAMVSRPQDPRINHEETKKTKEEPGSTQNTLK